MGRAVDYGTSESLDRIGQELTDAERDRLEKILRPVRPDEDR